MGKVRIKTFGDEEAEGKAKAKKEAKKQAKKAASTDVAQAKAEEVTTVEKVEAKPAKEEKKAVKKKAASNLKQKRSEKYLQAAMKVDAAKQYSLSEALDVLPQLHLAKFDETVELHINTTEAGVSGTITLPHGTGKKVRVAIADDTVLAEIEKGKINFDILLATPQMMPKLAKVAKVLGPKGLMPNPKNGTITQSPEDTIKKFEKGQVSFKTENKLPVLHVSVGKLSFGKDKLSENIKTFVGAINSTKIKKAVLKSTMSPGIKVDLASL